MTGACVLHWALGREEECTGEDCALWERGCTIEELKLDLAGRQDLAGHLLELRERLEQCRND